MDRQQLDYICEKGILWLTIAMVSLAVIAFGGVEPWAWIGVQSLTLALVLLWLPRFWLRSGYRVLWPPMAWAVVLFLGYAAWRYTEAPVDYAARQELLQILVYALIFFAIVDNLQGQDDHQKMVFVMMFLGMSVAMYGVYQFITDSRRVLWLFKPAQYAHRGSGTFICPNHLAGFLEMLLPVTIAFVLTGRLKHVTKVFVAYAGLAMLAGIGVSVSRGGWLATVFSIALMFLLILRNRNYRLPALIVLVLLIGGGAWFFSKADKAQQRFNQLVEQDKTKDIRYRLWQPTVQIWKDNYWWGVGPNQFDHAFRKYRPHDIQMRPLYAHNDYVNTLADYGLAGMTLIGGAMALFFFTVARVWKFVQRSNDIASRPSNRLAIVIGCTFSVVAILIHSTFDFNMHIPANALVLVVLMALVGVHVRYASESFWFNPRLIGKLVVSLVLLASATLLAASIWSGTRQEAALARVRRATDAAAQVEALKQAHLTEPSNFETVAKLAETLWSWSWEGDTNYEQLAREAMKYFELGMKLNPLDPLNHARYGMCLHWIGQSDKAAPHFERALALDPQSYFIVGLRGWHEFQLANYEDSRKWFEKSRELALRRFDDPFPDRMSAIYLPLIEKKLQEKAGGIR